MDSDSSKGIITISRKSFSERVKSAFFETVCFIGISSPEKESTRTAVLRLLLIELRWFLQLLPYLEQEETQENGTVVRTFWLAVSCIRPDMIMSYLQAAWVWMVLVWIGVTACWLLFTVVFTFTLLNKRTHPRVRKLLQIFGQLLLSLISVPSANILLATWFPDARFGNGISDSLRTWGGYMSLMVYLGLVSFQCTMILATFEYDLTQRLLRSKCEMDHDFLTLVVAQTTMISYYILYDRSKILHLCFTSAIATSLALRCYRRLPYYKSLANGITLWSRSAFAWSSFAFLIGEYVSPLCSLFLVLGVSISLAVILSLGLDNHQSSCMKFFASRLQEPLPDFQFDLGLRYLILSAVKETDPLTRTSLCHSVIHHIDGTLTSNLYFDRKRLILMKYLVYLNLMKDERAARVCLSQAILHKSSITSSFLEFKAKWMLAASSELEEIVFLRYLEKLEYIKRADKLVCQKLNDLWSELGSYNPDSARVLRLSAEISGNIAYLKVEFKQLVKNFPIGSESYQLYGSFLIDVLGKREEGDKWLSKADLVVQQQLKMQEKEDSETVSFFDPGAGVVLADTGKDNFGGIVFMSPKAAEHLEVDIKSLQMYKLNHLIPPPFSNTHMKNLRNFVDHTVGAAIVHPDQVPLHCSSGFIVFSAVKMCLTSNGTAPIIALAFKPLKSLKEGAVLSEEGVVLAHTENFAKFCGCPETHIEGVDLYKLRPHFFIHRKTTGNSPSFRLFTNRSFCGMFATAQFAHKTINLFYVFKSGECYSDRECTKWDFASYDYKASFLHSTNSRSDIRPSLFFRSSDDEQSSMGRRTHIMAANQMVDASKLTSTTQKSRGFLSSTNANTGKRVDVILLRRKVKAQFRWSNYLSILTVFPTQIGILVALNLAVIITLRNDVQNLLSNLSSGQVVVKEIYAAQMTINARGYFFDVRPELNQQFQDGLKWFADMLLEEELNIWNQIDSMQDSEYTKLNTETLINTWELLGGEIVLHPRTLIDAVGSFIDAVGVMQSAPVATAKRQSDVVSSIFYIFRNGIGEMKSNLEKSRTKFAEIEANQLNQAVTKYFLFPVLGLVVMSVFCFCFIVIILSVMKTELALGKCLLDNPLSLYLEQKKKVVDRLSNRYEIEAESGIEKSFRGKRKIIRIANPLKKSGFVVIALFICSCSFYFSLYFGLFLPVTKTMQKAPDLINSYAGLMASLSEAYLWSYENRYYKKERVSINAFVPEYLIAVNPIVEEDKQLKIMSESVNSAMREYLEGYPLQESHFDLLYRNAVNESDYYLHTGLHNAIKALKWDFLYCQSQDPSACTPLMKHTNQLQTFLANNSLTYLSYFNEDTSQAAYSQLTKIEGLTIGFTVSLLVFLVLFLLCVLRKDYEEARYLWKLAALLPSRYVAPSKCTALPETSQLSRILLK